MLDGASSTPLGRVSARDTRVGPDVDWPAELLESATVTASAGGVAAAPEVAEPEVACRSAMARTSPVLTSMTTAVPL